MDSFVTSRTEDEANQALKVLTENYRWEEVVKSMGSGVDIISATLPQQVT